MQINTTSYTKNTYPDLPTFEPDIEAEPFLSRIVRPEIDRDPDLENYLIDEKQTKIIYGTIFFCSITLLLTVLAW